MTKLSISVVLPNYNHAAFLPRALECLLRQTLPPDEIIAIDDCSTDNSVEILQEFARRDSRIVVLRNERNLRTVATLNRGIAAAKGDLLFLAASDDLYRPRLFEQAATALEACPQAALFCGMGMTFEDGGGYSVQDYGIEPPARYLSPNEVVEHIRQKFMPPINSSATVWRRRHVIESGGLIPEWQWSTDYVLWQILAFRHGIWYDPTVYADVRFVRTAYSAANRSHWERQAAVLRAIATSLSEPQYRDVAGIFRETGTLSTDPRLVHRFATSDPLGRPYAKVSLRRHASSRSRQYLAEIYERTPRPILRFLRGVLSLLGFRRPENPIRQFYVGEGFQFAESLFAPPTSFVPTKGPTMTATSSQS